MLADLISILEFLSSLDSSLCLDFALCSDDEFDPEDYYDPYDSDEEFEGDLKSKGITQPESFAVPRGRGRPKGIIETVPRPPRGSSERVRFPLEIDFDRENGIKRYWDLQLRLCVLLLDWYLSRFGLTDALGKYLPKDFVLDKYTTSTPLGKRLILRYGLSLRNMIVLIHFLTRFKE